MRYAAVFVLTISFAISGCAGIKRAVEGPPPIVGPRGPILEPVPQLSEGRASGTRPSDSERRAPVADNSNSVKRFNDAFLAASAPDASWGQVQRMRDSAFSLIDLNCDGFFTDLKRYQVQRNVAADVVSALGTLAAGTLAVIKFKDAGTKDSLIAALALGSSTASTGIDIYTRNFLFGAENVDAVGELTMRALATHRTQVARAQTLSFDDMIINIVDHQNICTPTRISRLAKDAIANARIVPFEVGKGQSPALTDAEAARVRTALEQRSQDDVNTLRQLGSALQSGSAVPVQEAGALWMLLLSDTTSAERVMLAGLVPPGWLASDGTRASKTDNEQQAITSILQRLSPETRDAFRSEVSRLKAAWAKPDATATDKTARFAVAGPQSGSQGNRTTVGVASPSQ